MKKLLVIGAGDVAGRALAGLARDFHVTVLVRSAAARERFDRAGAATILADLDDPASLAGIAADWDAVLHLAPPPEAGDRDTRTRNLLAALEGARMLPRRFVYISTSGVYGDCGGDWVDEDRPVNPGTDRARRRVDAERTLLDWGERSGVAVSVLRVPGIYAADRLPLARLERGTPVLVAEDDVYTNHIHADDLAAVCAVALAVAMAGRVYNVSDDSHLKMGDYFDLVADRNGLARPPRISRAEAVRVIPPTLLSFMSESRRLVNRRMKAELGVRLRYPTVFDGVPDRRFASVASS
ncbi:MAG: SDR family oxidoreductase [Burkholderiales bacterium]|nr:SDR family oxidoreductase [Burkholderiales bacterium]